MPSKHVAQFDLWLSRDSKRVLKLWEDAFEEPEFSLQGTEFELEWSFAPNSRTVDKLIEADVSLKAIWLVNPRSQGMITDEDVETLWRFSGFPINS